jgi:imidazoleglycerol-phosphate dehydratase
MGERKTKVSRSTDETGVKVVLDLDGNGRAVAETGAPFLDQMLLLLVREAHFDLEIQCSGGFGPQNSLLEETGQCLGLAFNKALGIHNVVAGAGYALVPVEELLARAIVEITGHSCFVLRGTASAAIPGGLETGWLARFWRAFASQARITLHLEVLYGGDGIPAYEGLFRAVGRALRQACALSPLPR